VKSKQVKRLTFFVREGDRRRRQQAVVEGLILANFDSDKYKTDKKPGNESLLRPLPGGKNLRVAMRTVASSAGGLLGNPELRPGTRGRTCIT